MPVPNDLTPEEEAMFGTHGVAPAGPGQEPTGEVNQPVIEQPASPHGDRQPQPRAENGQFTSAQPDPNAAPQQPQGQQPQGQQPQGQEPTDPNAPVDPNAQPQGQQAPPPPGFVPHQALHQERARAQELARQNAMLMARTNAILSRQQPQAEQLPDLNVDPVGYVQALGERMETFQQTQFEQQRDQQIHQAIEAEEANFRTIAPDYDQASDHYVNSRAQELLHFYPPQQAQQIMLQEARQMAQEAWQRGIPAAQMVYQMAQARGYRPGTAPQPQQMMPQGVQPGQPATQQPQGQQFAPATPQQPQPQGATPQQQVQAIRQGQGAARSLSTGAGGAAPAQLNAEALLAMSDEEFEAHFGLGTKGANQRFANVG